MWQVALLVFLAGSVLTACAWSLGSLIVFRVLQGIGGGMLMPIMQTVLVRNVGQERARPATAAMAVPAVIAPILGPLVGGLLLQWAGWRWIFLINVPICVAAMLVAQAWLSNDAERGKPRLDLTGLLLLSPGLALTTFAISRIGHAGAFTDPLTTCSLSLGVLLSVAFVGHSGKAKTEPLVDVKLFSIRSFRASSLLLLLSSMVFYGGLLLIPLYLHGNCGLNTMWIGILLGVQGISTLISRSYLEPLSKRWGEKITAALSILATFAGTLYFVWPASAPNLPFLIAALGLRGAGLGLLTILAMATGYREVAKSRIAHASVALRIQTQVGASFGVAILAVLLQNRSSYSDAFLWLLLLTLAMLLPASRFEAKEEPVRPIGLAK